jgi:hypothetical protein
MGASAKQVDIMLPNYRLEGATWLVNSKVSMAVSKLRIGMDDEVVERLTVLRCGSWFHLTTSCAVVIILSRVIHSSAGLSCICLSTAS